MTMRVVSITSALFLAATRSHVATIFNAIASR